MTRTGPPLIASSLFVLLCACSTSTIIPLGDNTYGVATRNDVRISFAREQAWMEASEYCEAKGLKMVPLGEHTAAEPALGEQFAEYDIIFRCSEAAGDKGPVTPQQIPEDVRKLEQQERKSDELLDSR